MEQELNSGTRIKQLASAEGTFLSSPFPNTHSLCTSIDKLNMKILTLYSLLFISFFSFGQTTKTLPRNNRIHDSTEIINLLKKVYEWHNKNQSKLIDFDVIVKDSFQTGINYDSFNKTFAAIKKTNFFSTSFINNYKKIADYINFKLTNANPKYPNEINFAYQDEDTWTHFQDDAGQYWKTFKISNLALLTDKASLKWCIKNGICKSNKYVVKFEKENGMWKLSYLEGFDLDKYYK